MDDEGAHIPVYRNLDYTITVGPVAKNGVANPADAVTSNGNVSTTAVDLSDISDGISGLYALYTDRTYVVGDEDDPNQTFQYQYIPDLSKPTTYKQGEILEVSGDALVENPTPGEIVEGWYPVNLKLKKSSDADAAGKDLITTFKVRGTSETGAKLFRIITIRVIRTPKYVAASTGPATSGLTYNLGLPGDLPSSMFPIVFNVYDSAQCLNPSGTDMPARTANKDIYYVKTVTADDYANHMNADKTVSVIPLNFKKVKSGTTTVTVKCDYFPDTSGTITVQ